MRSLTHWTPLLLLLLPSREARCQAAGDLRVRAGAGTIIQGQLAGRSRDTLFIENGGKAVGYVIERDYFVERYQPRPAVGVGAVVGGLVGTAVGVAIARGQHATCDLSDPFCEEAINAVAAVIIGTALGAGAGAILGSLFKPMGWSRIDLIDIPETGPRITPILGRGRYGLMLEFRL